MSRLAKTVISETLVVQEFASDVLQFGQSEYAFTLFLPDLVTESIMCQFNENNLSTTYYLVAQMEPRNAIDFANLADKTSMLRTDYALYLYKPIDSVEEHKLGNPAGSGINPNLTKTLTMKVGGIGGLGASEASSVISLEKERFAPGEKIKIHFDVDNTKCKKAVKNFKVKLKRTIHCLSGRKGVGKPLLTDEEWLVTLKYEGCPEKVRETRTIEFQVPLVDKKFGSVENLHPELRHMVKMFSDSADNSLFKIEYVLDIFVKHQSKLEFGRGEKASFNIIVKSEEQNLPWVPMKEQSWMTAQDIQYWEPHSSYPNMYLTFTKNPDGTLTPVSSPYPPWETAESRAHREAMEAAARETPEDI